MKKKLLLIVLILITLCASAQMEVTSLKPLPSDLTAKIHPETDRNNKTCALFKIRTPNMDQVTREKLHFKGDAGTEIVKTTFPIGEIWVYLSPQARYLEIKHPDLGIKSYNISIEIEPAKTYEMIIKSAKTTTIIEEVATANYLVIRVTPSNARVYVDDDYWGVGNKSQMVTIGVDHEYRIECDLYHPVSGKIQVNHEKKTELDIILKPAFGFLSIDSKPKTGAEVLIDGKHAGVTPYVSERLASGQYEVQVLKEMYKPDTKSIRVIDNDTTEYVFNMAPDYAEPRFKSDPESQIYINGELKGTGQWSGRLKSGSYVLEARKEFHRSIKKTITLEPNQNGVIEIESPEPIYGKINVNSEPFDAKIFIDNKEYGRTPDVISDILIGVHTVRLEKDKCATISSKVTVEEGKTAEVNLQLPTGKELKFTSEPSGAKVYIDDNYLGDTPLQKHLAYGRHSVKVVYGNDVKTQTIDVTISSSENDYFFDLITGKEISITSYPSQAKLYIDNKEVGETPYNKKMSYGTYNVYAEKGDMAQTMKITVSKSGSDSFYLSSFKRIYKSETFFTLNGAYAKTPNLSFGLTFGRVKHFGWFVSLMSGTNFQTINTNLICYEDGLIDGEMPFYNGEKAMKRLSVIAGGMMKFNNSLSMKLGLGYGQQSCYWQMIDEQWVKNEDFCASGIDISAGLQFNFGGFVVSVDAVTTSFKVLEGKVGLGWSFSR